MWKVLYNISCVVERIGAEMRLLRAPVLLRFILQGVETLGYNSTVRYITLQERQSLPSNIGICHSFYTQH